MSAPEVDTVALIDTGDGYETLAYFDGRHWMYRTGSTPVGVRVVRTLLVIDPEDRDQIDRLVEGIEDHCIATVDRMQAALRGLITPPEPAQPIGPIVHAVMYRDHKMGTLCNSGAWGTPELFTAVTEHVTCPACREKLDGARAAS